MRKFARTLAVLMTVLSISSIAGVRGPGKYYGVVVFDRWDTCYVHSGVYLMYVSQKVNQPLRRYRGQAIVIDALRVYQPVNPGDGRIDRFRVIGAARSKRRQVNLDGLSLRVSPDFAVGSPKFVLEIRNQSNRRIELLSSELALTLFGKKTNHTSTLFDPSDGLSRALITRTDLGRSSGASNSRNDGCLWRIEEKPLAVSFTLKPRQKYSITISLVLPRGEYDFLCGYGGGVHEDKSLASNITAFDVDENGRAMLVNLSNRLTSALRR